MGAAEKLNVKFMTEKDGTMIEISSEYSQDPQVVFAIFAVSRNEAFVFYSPIY